MKPKREFIDKDNFWIDLQVQTPLSIAIRRNTITEQEIVKPYLEKLKEQIEEYKARQLAIAIGVKDLEEGKRIALEYVLGLIENLLSKDGEKA